MWFSLWLPIIFHEGDGEIRRPANVTADSSRRTQGARRLAFKAVSWIEQSRLCPFLAHSYQECRSQVRPGNCFEGCFHSFVLDPGVHGHDFEFPSGTCCSLKYAFQIFPSLSAVWSQETEALSAAPSLIHYYATNFPSCQHIVEKHTILLRVSLTAFKYSQGRGKGRQKVMSPIYLFRCHCLENCALKTVRVFFFLKWRLLL